MDGVQTQTLRQGLDDASGLAILRNVSLRPWRPRMIGTSCHDVIVIGTGPAGAMAAYELGKQGIRTLLIEKATLPRDKPCGGGLTAKVLDLLPFDLDAVIEQTIRQVELRWRLGKPVLRGGERVLVGMVQRARFDALLVDKALGTGSVTLMDDTALEALHQDPGRVEVRTSRGTFVARMVIGADGANGQSARLLGALRTRHLMPAIEADIAIEAGELERWQNRLQLDIGTLRGAYGWVFPKGDRLNVGVGAICGAGTRGSDLRAYARRHRLHTVGATARTLRQVGFVLPLRQPGEQIEWGRVLLAGDAAGLVEAFTGEGIYWALRSGLIAAASVSTRLTVGGPPAYEEAIDRELMPDLLAARRWAHIYLWWPRICHVLPTRSRRVWQGVEHLLNGKLRFSELSARLGPLAPLAERIPATLK